MEALTTNAAEFIGAAVARLAGHGDTVVGIDNLDQYYDPELSACANLRVTGARCGCTIPSQSRNRPTKSTD
jgi:nucleoside-diphosphate-sugar epimerase